MKEQHLSNDGCKIDYLEDWLSEDVRHVIYRTVQERGSVIREDSIWRHSTSQPEFILACEMAEGVGPADHDLESVGINNGRAYE